MSTATGTANASLDRRTLAVRGAVAVLASLAVNLLLLGVVQAGDLVEPFDPLSVPSVAVLTAAGAVGATVAYWVLTRRRSDPGQTFARVAAVVLVLSFVPDVALLANDPAATVPAVLVLMVMHVTVAAICVATLTGRLGVAAR